MKLHKTFETPTVKDEFRVWSQLIAPKLDLPQNIFSICHYGFTEMLNNVLEHSRSKNVNIHCTQNEFQTLFEISDDGVGVFEIINPLLIVFVGQRHRFIQVRLDHY